VNPGNIVTLSQFLIHFNINILTKSDIAVGQHSVMLRKNEGYMLWLKMIIHRQAIYLKNGAIFENKLLVLKCVFRFSLQLISETFLILRRIVRDVIKNVYWASCKDLIKFKSSGRIFRKILKYQIS
jgi:hypothetical protein